jgi:hypothetical protein
VPVPVVLLHVAPEQQSAFVRHGPAAALQHRPPLHAPTMQLSAVVQDVPEGSPQSW